MTNYRALYFQLAGQVAETIELLSQAQRQAFEQAGALDKPEQQADASIAPDSPADAGHEDLPSA